MTLYNYCALTLSKPGREAEFDAWYDCRHLHDVCAVPGVRSARRFRLSQVVGEGFEPPKWYSLAIYEIETDGDPGDVVRGIVKRSNSELMPLSEALNRVGMVQFIGTEVLEQPAVKAPG